MHSSKIIFLSVCGAALLMGQNAKLNWNGKPEDSNNKPVVADPAKSKVGSESKNQQDGYTNLNVQAGGNTQQSVEERIEQPVEVEQLEQFSMSNSKATYKVDSNMASILGRLHIGNGQCVFQFDLRKAPKNNGWRLVVKILSDNKIVLTDMVSMDDSGCVYKEHMMMMEGDEEQHQRDDFLEVKENNDMLLGKNKVLKIRKSVGMEVVENEPIVSLDERITGFLQIIQWIGTIKKLPKDGLTVRWVAASKPLLVKVTDESTNKNRIYAINKVDYTQQNDVKQVSIKFVFPTKHNSFSFPDRIIITMGGKELSLVKD